MRPPTKKKRKPHTTRSQKCAGKVRYRDHAEAIAALRRLHSESTRGRVPVRTYDCGLCGGWHLTSQAR